MVSNGQNRTVAVSKRDGSPIGIDLKSGMGSIQSMTSRVAAVLVSVENENMLILAKGIQCSNFYLLEDSRRTFWRAMLTSLGPG